MQLASKNKIASEAGQRTRMMEPSPGTRRQVYPRSPHRVKNRGFLGGGSGKVLLSVVCVEAYLYYRLSREALFPASGSGFRVFWNRFGAAGQTLMGVSMARILNFFAFAFAFVAPFTFYIVVLNAMVDSPHYLSLPPMPVVLVLYLMGLTAAYALATFRAYARKPPFASS